MKVATASRGLVEGPVFRVDDEAIVRGAAAFETLRVYGGRPFLLAEHLGRFRHSIEALALPPADGVEELVAQVVGGDGVLRLYRSTYEVVATFDVVPAGLEEQRARGTALCSVDLGAPALLAGVKSTSYAAAFAARRDAERAGADDALLVASGVVLETTTANIWWRRGDRLFTPATRAGVLPGVTRGFVLSVEAAEEGAFDVAELRAADEAFTTSSIREVMPVVALDGRPVGDGRPGPAAARLQAALRLRSAS
jgi:branched-subunit amino acid aminotransferase/4-amino-4-deoxychorismate lyase